MQGKKSIVPISLVTACVRFDLASFFKFNCFRFPFRGRVESADELVYYLRSTTRYEVTNILNILPNQPVPRGKSSSDSTLHQKKDTGNDA